MRIAVTLLRTLGLALTGAVIAGGFLRLEGGSRSDETPAPSAGQWARERDFGPGDERPNEPTVFMPNGPSQISTDMNLPRPFEQDDRFR